MIDSLSGAPLLGRFPRIDAGSALGAAEGLALWLSKQPATRILLREIGCE
jgi:dethiobiotin synthetase